MRLIVIRDMTEKSLQTEADILRRVFAVQPLTALAMEAARRVCYDTDDVPFPSERHASIDSRDAIWAVPRHWDMPSRMGAERVVRTGTTIPIDKEMLREIGRDPWLTVSDGRFAAKIGKSLLDRVLAGSGADVVAVQVVPELQAYQESVRLTGQAGIVGCRRLYRDVAEPALMPADWPHHVFIRARGAERLLDDGAPPSEFGRLVGKCRDLGLAMRSFAVAGTLVDLGSSEGLLRLARSSLSESRLPDTLSIFLANGRHNGHSDRHVEISPDARLIGPVLIGDDVRVEEGAVIVGPAVLCEHSIVERQALIDASIVGRTVTVEGCSRLTNACVMTSGRVREPHSGIRTTFMGHRAKSLRQRSVFRRWPRFSYAGGFKRLADIVAAAVVLILFAPILPVIALAIKINSPGPVFYKDRRQGLHGRPFRCIKFRTMKVGAAAIQDKLRFVSEVDGPQFKMNDDPRISSVGRFLRETCIDEIPQFFNVLWGQMSVVGPRPSPEAENTQCPPWRDARLSVRPGITGLWQVCRTREPFRDFQEWIHFDMKYVRELSPLRDLWICWRTFQRLLNSFVDQF
jgi:lipopolysaccharide/colanic/teichoic acid biosynthesis glycosyltransferase